MGEYLTKEQSPLYANPIEGCGKKLFDEPYFRVDSSGIYDHHGHMASVYYCGPAKKDGNVRYCHDCARRAGILW